MAPDPYLTARQRHVGLSLRFLQQREAILGGGFRLVPNRRLTTDSRWRIVTGAGEQDLGLREAEELVALKMAELGVSWLAVPHPGGARSRDDMLARLRLLPEPRFDGNG